MDGKHQQRAAVALKPAQSIEVSWIAGSEESSGPWHDSHGSLAISFCPGKRVGALRRDAKADLKCLKTKHEIDTVVCLLNEAELRVRTTSCFVVQLSTALCIVQSPKTTCCYAVSWTTRIWKAR